jgi:hypothetical protein
MVEWGKWNSNINKWICFNQEGLRGKQHALPTPLPKTKYKMVENHDTRHCC